MSLNKKLNFCVSNMKSNIYGDILRFKELEMSKTNIETLIYKIFSSAVSIFPIKDISVTLNTNKNTFKSVIPKQHLNSDFGEATIKFTSCCKDEEEESSEIYLYIPLLHDGIYFKINGNLYNPEIQFIDTLPYVSKSKPNQRSITIKTLSSPIEIIRRVKKRPKLLILNPNYEKYGTLPYSTFWYIYIFKSQERKLLLYMIPKYGLINTLIYFGVDPTKITVGVLDDASFLVNHDFNSFTSPFSNKTFFIDNSRKSMKKKMFISIDKEYEMVEDENGEMVREEVEFTPLQINIITNLMEALSRLDNVDDLMENEANPAFWYNKINNYDMTSKLSNPQEKFTNTTNGLMRLGDSITLSISKDLIINENGHDESIFDLIVYCVQYFNHLIEASNNKKNFNVKRGRVSESCLYSFMASINRKSNRLNIMKNNRINNQTLIRQLSYRYSTVILDNIKSSGNKSSSGVSSNANALDAFPKYTIRGDQGVATKKKGETILPDYMSFHFSELKKNALYKSHNGGPGLKGIMAAGANISDIINTLQGYEKVDVKSSQRIFNGIDQCNESEEVRELINILETYKQNKMR